jgi:hypothetical protein
MAVIFFKLLTQRGREIERAAILTRHGRYAGTALQSTHLKTLFQTPAVQAVETPVTVQFCDGQMLSFCAAPEHVMRSRVGESHQGVEASYWRWAVSAEMCSAATQPLWGISEQLQIRRLPPV